MPASYIGLPALTGTNAKVLLGSEYQREMTGLEIITESYTVRSENRISIQPDRNTLHSSFSTATLKHPRMQVENSSFREQPGGLAVLSVTYVGLTGASGLPAPVIRLLPVNNNLHIEAEYVTDQSENSFISLGNSTRMPGQLNGYPMPANPAPNFLINNANGSVQTLGYCYDETETVRRGAFLVVRSTFRKKTLASGQYAYLLDL